MKISIATLIDLHLDGFRKFQVGRIFRLPTNGLLNVHLCMEVVLLHVQNHCQIVVGFIVSIIKGGRFLILIYCSIYCSQVE